MSDDTGRRIVQDEAELQSALEEQLAEQLSEELEPDEQGGVLTDEELHAFVNRAMQFLTGIGTDPITLTFLGQCSWEDVYSILEGVVNIHSQTAIEALYAYVGHYHPELQAEADIDAKVTDIEENAELWWRAPIETDVGDPTPVATMHLRYKDTPQWVPVYNFGVTLKPVGPDITGSPYEGYEPCILAKVIVESPTKH